MASKTAQALEIFIEREYFHENGSLLTYMEEEEFQDYFDIEWDEQDAAATSCSRRSSVEAICSSCTVEDAFSVLGECTTQTSPKKTTPRRMSNPLQMPIEEPRTSDSMGPTLYRPSVLGLTSIIGDPRRRAQSTRY